jgi:hypothetical protein
MLFYFLLVVMILQLILACQGAVKIGHLGAFQSVPHLIEKMIRFSYHLNRRIEDGKQVKDGTKRVIISFVFPRLVIS